jgi:hypothetical protein
VGSNQLAVSGQNDCSRKAFAAFQCAAITAAMASSVSLGGSHKGQLILVVIIVTLHRGLRPAESVSPYMSGSNGHEFLKKPSLFSDENAHHGGNRVREAVPQKPRHGTRIKDLSRAVTFEAP